MKKKKPIKIFPVKDPRQRKALTSPLRQEILGQFAGRNPLTVADLASRMGRPPTAIYYHVHRLEEVGLLERVGKRPGPRRDETLYLPLADEFDLTPVSGDRGHVADAVSALATAHRMAVVDLKAALESDEARYDGADRNLLAYRLHARLSSGQRTRANALLDELLNIFLADPAASKGTGGEFCSLTVALAPLRGRDQEGAS